MGLLLDQTQDKEYTPSYAFATLSKRQQKPNSYIQDGILPRGECAGSCVSLYICKQGSIWADHK
jgi:hypothetical protein